MRKVSSGPRRARQPGDLFGAAVNRAWRLPPRRNQMTVDRGLEVPMRDGAILLADHYAPVTDGPRPTVLMRGPYGRGWEFSMLARPFAERGYHVLMQSTRGTFGSGGVCAPGTGEAADGHDTVAWLRAQDWFNGRLVTVGASYLAFVSWALATEPPPELTAMAVYVSPHDLAGAGLGHGAFELFNLLTWSELLAHQELIGAIRGMWRMYRADKRLAAALNLLPLAATAEIVGPGAPWYSEWLGHPEAGDPYWTAYQATAALDQVTVPTLLVTGFHDFFIEQTLQQYQALHGRGVPAGLTIGPWSHLTLDMGIAIRETLAWLDAFADGNGAAGASPGPRPQPVRVWTSGTRQWRELPEWPPAGAAPATWYLQPGGGLAAQPQDGSGGETSTSFRYDPADPTPSVGGRIMSMTTGGSRNNARLEARADVLTFSTAPLRAPVQAGGTPSVRLYLTSDNAYCDIFARLCDVDERGLSRNLTDQIVRLTPAVLTPGAAGEVTLQLTDVSHVFGAGHRIRLQVSGGAHPRFARNLGTGENPATSTAMAPVTHQVLHSAEHPSALVLPVLPARPGLDGLAEASSAARPASSAAG
jgi:putative CocE/NonD family hydrolase